MVIAIIALISTLAIHRLSGLHLNSARKLSLANQVRVASAVETYLAANDAAKLNRLDALLDYDVAAGTGGSVAAVSTVNTEGTGEDTSNQGLNSNLASLLCVYNLSTADANALRNMGLNYVMRNTTTGVAQGTAGADGAMLLGQATDPDTAACYAFDVTNGLACMAINPLGNSWYGALTYQACGQDVVFAGMNNVEINGTSYTSLDNTLISALKQNGGLLLAFGLGDPCSIIGSSNAGLDSAPVCSLLDNTWYRRYIVLIRLKTVGERQAAITTAEFAGILDPVGNTIKQARFLLR